LCNFNSNAHFAGMTIAFAAAAALALAMLA
jgi:hypothetical protein